jgi:hypothetical protein
VASGNVGPAKHTLCYEHIDINPLNVYNGTTFLEEIACCGGRSRLRVAYEGSVIHPEGGASVSYQRRIQQREHEKMTKIARQPCSEQRAPGMQRREKYLKSAAW